MSTLIESAGSNSDQLISRAAGGDQGAQAALLEHYRGRLRRMVGLRLDKLLAARVDPSDVVQETLNAAHQRLNKYLADPRIPFYPWLRRIATDRLADAYRDHIGAERRSVLREHPWTPELTDESNRELARCLSTSDHAPSRHAMRAEEQARMLAALERLKPHDREVLVLRYLEQMGVEEIAATLGISETAVTSRHLRALERLRRNLLHDGDR